LKRLLTFSGFSVAGFAAIGSLTWPLGRDQGIFAWVGEVILRGGLPYRDAWDIKGPLSYYYYALGLAAFGHSALAIRILDLVSVAACCWVLRRLVIRLTGGNSFGANCAVIFFLLGFYGGGFWNAAQPDAWGGMLVLIAVALLLDLGKPVLVGMAAIGGLIALATLFKPTFAIFIALPIVAVLSNPVPSAGVMKPLLACGFAFLFILLSMLLILRLGGNLPDFIDVNRFVAISHSGIGSRHVLAELISLGAPLFKLGLLFPFLLAPFGVWRLRAGGRRSPSNVLAVWLALAIALVIIQGKFWLYHWIPAVIAAAATSGIAISHLTGRFADSSQTTADSPQTTYRRSAITLILFLALMTPVALRALFHSYTWPSYAFGLRTKEQYSARFQTPEGRWQYADFAKVSDYISRNSTARDTIVVWGWDPLVNVLAQRATPTRFGYSYPLTIAGPMRDLYRSIFLRDINAAPPRYIIVDGRDPWELPAKSGLSLLREFAEFDSLIHRRYALAVGIDAYEIWELKPSREWD
jgi:hypothetical protein